MPTDDRPARPRRSLPAILARPSVATALVTLVAAQVVMVLIMTMTPLHLIDHGHGLATVGFVLSAHTFGMFGLSPITGRLTDRFGSPLVIAAGLVGLALAALLAALAPPDGGLLLTFALFLLGYGWNLCFVAASSLVSHGLSLAERTRVQGIADALTWGTAAFASLSSGLVVAAASYTVLGFVGIGADRHPRRVPRPPGQARPQARPAAAAERRAAAYCRHDAFRHAGAEARFLGLALIALITAGAGPCR